MLHDFKSLAVPIRNVKKGLEHPSPSGIAYEAFFSCAVQSFTLEELDRYIICHWFSELYINTRYIMAENVVILVASNNSVDTI